MKYYISFYAFYINKLIKSVLHIEYELITYILYFYISIEHGIWTFNIFYLYKIHNSYVFLNFLFNFFKIYIIFRNIMHDYTWFCSFWSFHEYFIIYKNHEAWLSFVSLSFSYYSIYFYFLLLFFVFIIILLFSLLFYIV